jgi:hypothetical protein
MHVHFHRWFLVVPLLAALAVAVRADDAKKTAKQVKVTVVVILATDRNTEVDPKIKCIADEVQKLPAHKNLTGFRQARMTTHAVEVGKASSFDVVEDQKVGVTVLEAADQEGKVRLTVAAPKLVGDITYSTACGKCLPIVTSQKTKDHELVIIAVMVKPCTK